MYLYMREKYRGGGKIETGRAVAGGGEDGCGFMCVYVRVYMYIGACVCVCTCVFVCACVCVDEREKWGE